MREYVHQQWVGGDGILAPPAQALAVGPDGYLWVSSARELLRFDGVRFTPWRPGPGEEAPVPDVRLMISAPDGVFWMASGSGVTRIAGGRLRSFPDVRSRLGKAIVSIAAAPAGGLWVVGEGPREETALATLAADGGLRVWGTEDGLPAGRIESIAAEGGGLWLGTSAGVCRWSPGARAACEQPSRPAIMAVARAATGLLGALDAGGTVWLQSANGAPWHSLRGDSLLWRNILRSDREGNLWAGGTGGLLRIQNDRVEHLTHADGLSGTIVSWIAEDREGDLWVATDGGIDRFQDPRVRHLSSADGLSSNAVLALAAGRDGAVWAGTVNGLNRIRAGKVEVFGEAQGLPGPSVTALFEDPLGRLWAATGKGLFRFDGRAFRAAEAPGGPLVVYGMGGGRDGTVWATDDQRGLFAVRDGRVQAAPVPIPQLIRVTVDTNGALWLGSHNGRVGAMRNGHLSEYPAFSGPVRAIYEDRAGSIWVGGGNTIGRYRNGRWTMWAGEDALAEGPVQGILEDDRGGFWVVTATAALRFSKEELDGVPGGAPRKLRAAEYGTADGLRLNPAVGSSGPRVVKSPDGRIWICERASIGVLDPATLRRNPVPPPVAIERINVDGRALEARAGTAFRGREVHIGYTGISLMAPERVTFRYRLQPLRKQWTEAGTNRAVTYVDLPPRRYRFEVTACNLDGVCNEAGAAVDFEVEPYFYQTYWFEAFCLGLAGLAAWGGWQYRLRRLTERFQLVAQERARMTREIHDSLLQGFAGVVYQLDAAARQFDAAPAESRKKLDRALDLADQALREAREVLSTMRLPALEDRTLPEALGAACAPVAEEAGMEFSLKVRGRVTPLPYEVQAGLFLIGREAVTNAAKHAHGRRVEVFLTYDRKGVRLAVHDDGTGFDAEQGMALSGHWGLRGMQERAEQLGARFRMETAPGKGTQVEVVVAR